MYHREYLHYQSVKADAVYSSSTLISESAESSSYVEEEANPRPSSAERFLAAAARSLCRRFLNQLPTCVGVSPVAAANSLFLVGLGYGSCKYHSRRRDLVRSLKQCVFCSPSQIVRGKGNFLRTRYLSTGPSGRPLSLSAS